MEQSIDTQQLRVLRRITRAIGDHLTRELNGHLSALAPLFVPRSVLGVHVGGTSDLAVRSADSALTELTSLYQTVHRSKPFNLRSRFDTPIDIMGASPLISPHEYAYSARSDDGSKAIRVSSPLRWVLSYDGFGQSRLRELLGKQREAVGPQLQQCVLHCLIMNVVLGKRPGIVRLLEAIRFPVSIERSEEFGELAFPLISCPLTTIRPADEVLVESTEISGAPSFEEVVDLDQVAALSDPFKDEVMSLIRKHGDEQTSARFAG